MPPYFIAVHAGAGYHGPNKEAAYAAAMRSALRAAAAALDQGCSSMDAVKTAICALEDAPITNAGYGSNLSLQGSVECDAGIMAGDGTCGAVGAVPGVDNPIAAAHRLAELSRLPLPCGLVRPTLLVGDAARSWAVSQGLVAAATQQEAAQRLVSPAAAAAWQKYRGMLAAAEAAAANSSTPATAPSSTTVSREQQQQQQQQGLLTADRQKEGSQQEPPAKRPRVEPAANDDPGSPQMQRQHQHQQQQEQQPGSAAGFCGDVADTVGCVVVDAAGCVAAGVSSGGLAMKQPGRVGEAAVLGAGCWAADGHWRQLRGAAAAAAAAEQGAVADSAGWQQPGVAVSASGVGERIMAASLAKATGMQLQLAAGQHPEPLAVQLLQSSILSQPGPWDAGVLAVRVDGSCSGSSSAGSSSSSSRSSSSTGRAVQPGGADEGRAATSGSKGQGAPTSGCQHQDLQHQQQQHQQQQQHGQQQQRRLFVELVAAFTSPSFAIGWLSSEPQAKLQLQVLRQHDHRDLAAVSAVPDQAPPHEDAPGDGRHGPVQQPQVKCMEICCSWPLV